MWHLSATISEAENLHSITCLIILHPNIPPLSSKNKCIALPISRSTFSFLDETMEGILSSFICSIFFNILKFVFLLSFRRVDISDFPQSRSVKLQQDLLTEEDEQKPLSVHLVPLSEEALTFFLTGFYFKTNHATPL